MPDDDSQDDNGGYAGPPGYPPPPGAEPTYQAPAPTVPPVYPPTAGYPATTGYPPTPGASPFGPPPGPPLIGAPGLPNGSVHSPAAVRPRRRARTVAVVLLVVVVAIAAASVGVVLSGGPGTTVSSLPPATASPGVSQLLRTSVAAARSAGSFHYVATSKVTGSQGYSQKTVGDAGADSGRQDITVGTQKFTVLVVGTACYLEGNASALEANLGLSSTAASAHAGQWISLARTDAPYASVYAAVTAPSALTDNITITPTSQLPTTRLDGRRVQTITGTIASIKIGGQTIAPKGTATLAVRTATPHLPVRYAERGTQGRQKSVSSVTFSRWGEAVTITAPSGAVPYASLGAGTGTVPSSPSGTVLT